MKRTVLILLLIFLSSPAHSYDWTQDANCQGAWLFTEGSGTSVADSSQNTNTGNFKGAGEPAWAAMAGTNAPSYSSYMVTYDATDDYINAGTDTSLNFTTQDFSIVSWVITGDNSIQGLIANRGQYGSDGYYFQLIGGELQLVIRTSGANKTQLTNNTPVANDTWTHVVAIRTGTQQLDIFADGVECSYSTTADAANLITSARPYLIGQYAGPSTTLGWNGSIGEQAAFDKSLDSTDINDIMDNGLVQAAAGRTRRFF